MTEKNKWKLYHNVVFYGRLVVDQIFNAEGLHVHLLSIMLYNFVKNCCFNKLWMVFIVYKMLQYVNYSPTGTFYSFTCTHAHRWIIFIILRICPLIGTPEHVWWLTNIDIETSMSMVAYLQFIMSVMSISYLSHTWYSCVSEKNSCKDCDAETFPVKLIGCINVESYLLVSLYTQPINLQYCWLSYE